MTFAILAAGAALLILASLISAAGSEAVRNSQYSRKLARGCVIVVGIGVIAVVWLAFPIVDEAVVESSSVDCPLTIRVNDSREHQICVDNLRVIDTVGFGSQQRHTLHVVDHDFVSDWDCGAMPAWRKLSVQSYFITGTGGTLGVASGWGTTPAQQTSCRRLTR